MVDKFIKPLVWCSIILLFVELGMGSENSLSSGMWLFLWIERITASIFIVEYFCRWYEDHSNPDGNIDVGCSYYPMSVMGVIDLLSWLPFIVGFFIPVNMLGWCRALRVLRVFKLFRYNRTLQLFALAIYKSWWFLRAIFFVTLCFGLLASALIFQAEKVAQPDTFGNIYNLFWYIATADSTVGFGDMYPVTPLGKILTVLLVYLPGIAVFGSVMGVIGNSLAEVLTLEKDPSVDPIEEFKKEYNKRNLM